jgi:hypothetical protein
MSLMVTEEGFYHMPWPPRINPTLSHRLAAMDDGLAHMVSTSSLFSPFLSHGWWMVQGVLGTLIVDRSGNVLDHELQVRGCHHCMAQKKWCH